jgi:hypothetical protein
MTKEIIIKGQPLSEWETWLESELTPPVHVEGEAKYVVEGFLELIQKIKELQKNP